MCTVATYRTKDHYFGRTLDLSCSYNEMVTVTPRNFPFRFRRVASLPTHYAMIGMATVIQGVPLYYEATNEKGLSIAGLLFPGNAVYHPEAPHKDNVAPFELIPWLLGQCATIEQVRQRLERVNLINIPFSRSVPLSRLHWMISDKTGSLTVESVQQGLKVYDNPAGILTNNPPFDIQMFNLNQYMGLSTQTPPNRFASTLPLAPYCQGMGALGLPGDHTSLSRFVKASFVKMNAVSDDSEAQSISQLFHILGAVAMPRGCVQLENGDYDYSIYTSCCNTDKGVYYYTTYDNSQISGVDMHKEDLNSSALALYPLLKEQQIHWQN